MAKKSYTSISLDSETKKRLQRFADSLGLSPSFVLEALTYKALVEKGVELGPHALEALAVYHRALVDRLGGLLNLELVAIVQEMVEARRAFAVGKMSKEDYFILMRVLREKLDSVPVQMKERPKHV